ncbi:MAG: copper resistance protein CopC [Chloroflexi bacterium]|nr:copper resistance protein CopC [Chloroflexota bacterium]
MRPFTFFFLIGLAVLFSACASSAPSSDAPAKKETPASDAVMKKETAAPDAMLKLPDQIFAAHFVDATPKHGEALAKLPAQVVINFNFTLSDPSTITVLKDDKPIDAGKAVLAANKLSMSSSLPTSAGDGLFIVKYKACWPDRSCHDGLYAFKVDSNLPK